MDADIDKSGKIIPKEKNEKLEDLECKEVELDYQLLRHHVSIDLMHIYELGKELCSEALKEIVTCEVVQSLFNKAFLKLQEVAAQAFFNWGNVYICNKETNSH